MHKRPRLQRWRRPKTLTSVWYGILSGPGHSSPLRSSLLNCLFSTWGSFEKGNWRGMGQSRGEAGTWYQGRGSGLATGQVSKQESARRVGWVQAWPGNRISTRRMGQLDQRCRSGQPSGSVRWAGDSQRSELSWTGGPGSRPRWQQ